MVVSYSQKKSLYIHQFYNFCTSLRHFRPFFGSSLTTVQIILLEGHVDADVTDARDEHVDEHFLNCFTPFVPLWFDLITVFTYSSKAILCVGVIRFIETCLTNWKFGLYASDGFFIHSSLILNNKQEKLAILIIVQAQQQQKKIFVNYFYIFKGLHVTWNSSSPLTARRLPIMRPLNVTSISRPCIMFSAFSKRYCNTSIIPTSKKSNRRAVIEEETE